jgi:hypothetical protein
MVNSDAHAEGERSLKWARTIEEGVEVIVVYLTELLKSARIAGEVEGGWVEISRPASCQEAEAGTRQGEEAERRADLEEV